MLISVDIPAFADVRLEHLVLDFNGTFAEEGTLLASVRPLIVSLAEGFSGSM